MKLSAQLERWNQAWRHWCEQVECLWCHLEWANQCEQFADHYCMSLADGLAEIRHDQSGPLVRQVLAQAQQGAQVCQAMILHAVLPIVVAQTQRDSRFPLPDLLSEVWLVMMNFNLNRAGNLITALSMDARSRLAKRHIRDLRLVCTPDSLLELPDHPSQDGHSIPSAATVIESGRRLRLVSDNTAQVLHTIYVEGLSGREASRLLGMSQTAIRRRCSDAVGRLRQHCDRLLA